MSFQDRQYVPGQIEALENRQLLSSVGDAYTPADDPRMVVNLNASWKFSLSAGSNAQGTGVDDSGWSSVNLPHTWNGTDAQDGGNNYRRGIGWYRKQITAPANSGGDELYLHFDGASLVTSVYVDGQAIGQHAGAFGGFTFDVTAALSDGQTHVLAVKTDNSASYSKTVAPSDGADFNVDGGLYRGVSLLAVAPQHASLSDSGSTGVFFSTSNVSSASAAIEIKTELENDSGATSVIVHSVLVDADGQIVSDSQTTQALADYGSAIVTQDSIVANPHLWNGVKDPYLHDLYVEVRDAETGALLDQVHQRVGIRSFQVDPNQGFLLNGQVYDLHGGMYQQDHRNEGWAISDADIRADVTTMMDLGVTAVRTHYQMPSLFYDLADQNGLIVLSEVPFNGSLDRTMTVSSNAFLANYEQQMQELVLQNYNRPSIVSWGLYNELSDTPANENLIRSMDQFTNALDPTRFTTGASWNAKIGTLDKETDALTFNRYYGYAYGVPSDIGPMLDAAHAAAPNLPIGLSEFGAGANITQHGHLSSVTAHGYWHAEEFQDQLYEQTWATLLSRTYLWEKTQFLLFDTADDSTNNNGATPGVSDTGLITQDRATKKDSYFYLKANWSTDPVLYLTSRRWTTRTDAVTDVKVYANVSDPQLYVNGALIGAMTALGNDVYSVPQITLSPGKNVITITGTRDDQTFSDTATWNYTGKAVPPTSPPPVNSPPVSPPPVSPLPITPPSTGSAMLSGVCFNDNNANAKYDSGDGATKGVTVFLDTNGNNALDAGELSTTTDTNGKFSFTGLGTGTYHVREAFYSGRVASTPLIDVNISGSQSINTLSIGASYGVSAPPPIPPPNPVPPPPPPPPPPSPGTGSISGTAFNDNNSNTKYDAGDGASKGITVFLDLNGNGLLDGAERSVLTDSNGKFMFSGLAVGTYHVRRVFPTPGFSYSTTAIDVALTAGQVKTGVSLGTKKG